MILQISQSIFPYSKEMSGRAAITDIFLKSHTFNLCDSFTSDMALSKCFKNLSEPNLNSRLDVEEQSFPPHFGKRREGFKSEKEKVKPKGSISKLTNLIVLLLYSKMCLWVAKPHFAGTYFEELNSEMTHF